MRNSTIMGSAAVPKLKMSTCRLGRIDARRRCDSCWIRSTVSIAFGLRLHEDDQKNATSLGADVAKHETDMPAAVRTPHGVEGGLGMRRAQSCWALFESCPRRTADQDRHDRAAQWCVCETR